MKLHRYLLSLFLATVFLGNPVRGLADDELTDSSVIEEAAVDYCYMGRAVDPSTGEIVDLYGFCEYDLDLA